MILGSNDEGIEALRARKQQYVSIIESIGGMAIMIDAWSGGLPNPPPVMLTPPPSPTRPLPPPASLSDANATNATNDASNSTRVMHSGIGVAAVVSDNPLCTNATGSTRRISLELNLSFTSNPATADVMTALQNVSTESNQTWSNTSVLLCRTRRAIVEAVVPLTYGGVVRPPTPPGNPPSPSAPSSDSPITVVLVSVSVALGAAVVIVLAVCLTRRFVGQAQMARGGGDRSDAAATDATGVSTEVGTPLLAFG